MSTAPSLVSLEEYMRTSYSPDCEYVDGAIVERNVGKKKHSFTQGRVYRAIADVLEQRNFVVLPEQRVRVSSTRVGIPDVCVIPADDDDEVTTRPPLLCVEILSPDDRWSCTNRSINDYLAMGVPCIWVVDPYERRAWIFDQDAPPAEIQDGMLRALSLDLAIKLPDVLPRA